MCVNEVLHNNKNSGWAAARTSNCMNLAIEELAEDLVSLVIRRISRVS